MENLSIPTKQELIAKIRAKRQIMSERVAQDTPRIQLLVDEFRKLQEPGKIFDSFSNLWVGIEHPPFFTHETDEKSEFLELLVSSVGLKTKRSFFMDKVIETYECLNLAESVQLPNEETLAALEIPELERLVLSLENDERFRNYLQCDVGKILEDWNAENVLDNSIDLVRRMEGMMAVATEKLRNIAQSMV